MWIGGVIIQVYKINEGIVCREGKPGSQRVKGRGGEKENKKGDL
jgi:hypothetical protein